MDSRDTEETAAKGRGIEITLPTHFAYTLCSLTLLTHFAYSLCSLTLLTHFSHSLCSFTFPTHLRYSLTRLIHLVQCYQLYSLHPMLLAIPTKKLSPPLGKRVEVICHHCLATRALVHRSRTCIILLVCADDRQFLIQSIDDTDMQEWMHAINKVRR